MSDKKYLFVTYCSKNKDKKNKLLSAIKRYLSERVEWVYEDSKKQKADFAILSGFFGLIKSNEKLPYYDYRLLKRDIDRVVKISLRNIKKQKYKKIFFFIEKIKEKEITNYKAVMKKLSKQAGISFGNIYIKKIIDKRYEIID